MTDTTEGAKLAELTRLVTVWAKAKGRYHGQIAAADLMEAVGVKGLYPEGYQKKESEDR